MTRIVRDFASIARPNTNDSTVAMRMPPTVAWTVSSKPPEIVLTNNDMLSNTTYSGTLAELGRGQVLRRQVVLREAERLHDRQPVTGGVQLLQLGVERVHQ